MNRKRIADNNNLADLRSTADIIDEVSAAVTYLGFCETGTTTTAESKWSILKIEKVGTITTMKWAEGLCFFNLVWDSRAGYEYLFRNF